MNFKEDTKKILDFFDNKELQEIFENNFIHKESEIEFLRYIQEQCQVGGNVGGIYDTCKERIKELKDEK